VQGVSGGSSFAMALDLKNSGKQRKINQYFRCCFARGIVGVPGFLRNAGASMADNLWQNSKNSESALHYRHRNPLGLVASPDRPAIDVYISRLI
jgi:hypothetical protein